MRVGFVVLVNVAVGTITVGEGTAVSDAVGVGILVGSTVTIGAKGLGVIPCVGSAALDVQPETSINRLSRIATPAWIFIFYPHNLHIPV